MYVPAFESTVYRETVGGFFGTTSICVVAVPPIAFDPTIWIVSASGKITPGPNVPFNVVFEKESPYKNDSDEKDVTASPLSVDALSGIETNCPGTKAVDAVVVTWIWSGRIVYGNCSGEQDCVVYPFVAVTFRNPEPFVTGVPCSSPMAVIVRPWGRFGHVKYVTAVPLTVDAKNGIEPTDTFS